MFFRIRAAFSRLEDGDGGVRVRAYVRVQVLGTVIYKLYNILMTTARIIGRSGDDDALQVFYRKSQSVF
jgi:hypothetical protein